MIRFGRAVAFNADFSGWGVSVTYWPGRRVALKFMRSGMSRALGVFNVIRGRLYVNLSFAIDFQHHVERAP